MRAPPALEREIPKGLARRHLQDLSARQAMNGINRITVDEFHRTADDVLRQAREGQQTIVEDGDGKTVMVIGVGNDYPFPVEDETDLEDVDISDLPRSTWLD